MYYNTMRKLITLVLLLTLLPAAFAIKGVGIKYSTEGATFIPGRTSCIPYQVYNPWDEDVAIELTATGELTDLFASSENAELPAGTSSGEAVTLKICFDVPPVSKSKCSETKYSGQVVAREATSGAVGGTGSATSVVASAPLTVNLNCDAEVSGASVSIFDGFEFGLTSILFLTTIFIASAVLMFLVKARGRNPERQRQKYMGMYHELLGIQEQLRYEPFDQQKQRKYHELWEKLKKMREGQ